MLELNCTSSHNNFPSKTKLYMLDDNRVESMVEMSASTQRFQNRSQIQKKDNSFRNYSL
jgi:hypothetical protein